MKIAVLSSQSGEKGLYLYDFFKEGNRVEVDCLVTDKENSEVLRAFSAEGIPAYYFGSSDWESGENIVRLIKERGAEIIVVDDLDRELPPSLKEAFGEAILYPAGIHEAPGEVVALYNKLTSKDTAKRKEKEKKNENLTPEEEWAEVLKVDYDAEEAAARAVPPPYQQPQNESPQPPEYTENHNGNPVPPQPSQNYPSPFGNPWSAHGGNPNPEFNRPGNMQNPKQPQEPMPDTYLIWSVLATIFCCLIPGIVAIIMSSSVSSRYFSGDIEGAKRASRRAEIWIIVSIICGIIWMSLYLPMMLISA